MKTKTLIIILILFLTNNLLAATSNKKIANKTTRTVTNVSSATVSNLDKAKKLIKLLNPSIGFSLSSNLYDKDSANHSASSVRGRPKIT